MKKLLQMIALVAMLAAPWAVGAQNTLTVADGTETNSYVPVYGSWMDEANRSQVIYPASEIAAATTTVGMTGGSITGLTYYIQSTATSAWTATMYIRIKEVNDVTLTSFVDMTDASLVYTGTLDGTSNTMTVTFDSAYTYQGGNLLIEVRSLVGGNYAGAYFYGVTSTGSSLHTYGSNSATQYNFIPKTTFTFTGGTAVTCPAISSYSVSNIDSSSATINWVDALNTGASYTVTCWPANATADDTLTATSSSSSAVLTGLEANTVYYYRVQVNCAGGDNSVSLGGSFRTGCGVNSLPYSTGFEDGIGGQNYFCWDALSTGTSNSGTFPSVYEYSNNAHSGSFYYEFESSALATEVAALPVIPSVSGTRLSFWAYCGNPDNVVFEAGVIEDDTVFVPFDRLNLTTSYQQYNVYFPSYSGNATRMGLRYTGRTYVMIDDLSIVEYDGCAEVRSLTVDTVTSDTIAISWSPSGGSETGYAVRLNGGEWIDVYDTFYVFEELSPSTLYTIDVVALCDDTSLARTLSVRTECADFINAPYSITDMVATQDPVSRLPFCWTAPETVTSYSTVYPYVYTYSNYVYFYPREDEPNMVVLPRVGNLAPNAINVEVNGYVSSYNPSKLYFGYLTNPDSASTFVVLDSITGSSRADYVFNTSSVSDDVDSIWLAFRATTTASYGYAYLYSVAISRYSTCARPDAVAVDTVGHNLVGLHWNGTGADDYQVALTTGTNPDVLTEDNGLYLTEGDTAIVITGLTPSTNYNVWVRSICSDDTSAWRQGPSIRTACGADYCLLTIDMDDEYGDGWGGNAVNVYVGSDLVTSFTILDGSTGSDSYPICAGDSVTLTYTSGSYPSDVTFTVRRAGIEVISGSGPDYYTGEVLASFVGCPTCLGVTSVVVDSTSANSITIHWTPSSEDDDTWAVSVDGVTVATNVTTTSYTFTGLTDNHLHTVGVATVCSESVMSDFATISAATACAGLACDVYVNLNGDYNPYGSSYNAWYYADMSVSVYQNGILRGTTSTNYSDPTSVDYQFSVCAGDSVQVVYNAGTYASYYPDAVAVAGYTITNGTGAIIASDSTMTGVAGGSVIASAMTSCPTCITPTNVAVASATTGSITFGWTDVTPAQAWSLRLTDEDGATTSYVATTKPYTVTGLQPSAYYWVSVAAICSAGDTSNYSLPVRVATECSDITLPWNYSFLTDFNSDYNDEMPICWYSPESYSTAYDTYPYAYNNGTSGYVYIYASSTGSNMAATPRIPESANNLYVTFTGYQSNNPLDQAGVMTDPSDPTTFIPLVQVTSNSAAEYEFFTDGVPGLTASDTVHVAFRSSLVPGGNTYGYFYLYNVHVQRAPATHRPDSTWVTAVTPNSATINWSATNATSYEVTIDGNTYTSTGTSVNVTGLSSGTNYTYSIVAYGTDTAIALRGAFATECATITLPYAEDFESYAQYAVPNCWTVKNTAADNYGNATPYVYTTTSSSSSYVHSGHGALYFYANSNKHPMAISPALTGESMDKLYVSFWVYGGGSYGFEAGFMTDPSNDSTFIPVLTVPGTSYSQVNYSFNTDSIGDTSSVYHFAIRYNNSGSYGGAIYVDDLIIRSMPDCAEDFASVRISDITADSAKVNFTPGLGINAGATYTATVLGPNNNAVTSVSGSTSPLQLSGLLSSTTYRVFVELTCGGAVTAVSDTVAFTTRCSESNVLAIEDTASGTNEYIPMSHYYRHSASQQIYRANELGGATTITSVAYNYLYSTPLYGYQAKIYLAHTADTAANGNWVDESTMQLVYDGDFNCVQGWNEFLFSTPFEYNGTDNIVVMVVADSTGYAASGYRFASHNAGVGASVRFANDTYEYEYGSSNITSSCYSTAYRNDIRFYACTATPCDEPLVVDTIAGELDITLAWTGEADGYEVTIVEGAWTEPTSVTPVTDTFYTFTGLTEQTQYTVGVRAACGNSTSNWVTIPVTTLRHPCAVPTAVTVSDESYDGATVSWTLGEAENDWEVRVFCASPLYDATYNVTGTPSVDVTGLNAGVTYSVAVRAVCDANWKSPWSDTVDLTTVTCQPVTGVGHSNLAATSVTITWTATGAASYEIEYGDVAFTTGNGTPVTSTTNSVQLTGLEDETSYDVYVRAVCAEGITSAWSERHTFTTPQANGIDDVLSGNVTLYPNPASTAVTIRGIEGESTVTVVDLNGREVYRTNADSDVTIDVRGYAKGAYFVRITGERTTAIRKLIVK